MMLSGALSAHRQGADQKERALISVRTKEGLKAARARGTRLGGWTAGSEASNR
jgi:DNA invertase Pin-like site-specific DNA recombinase